MKANSESLYASPLSVGLLLGLVTMSGKSLVAVEGVVVVDWVPASQVAGALCLWKSGPAR